jgi:hypothetical protein
MASITGLLQQSAQAQASRSRHPSPAINKTAVPRASSVPSSHFSTASAEASSAVQGCATRNRLRVAADGASWTSSALGDVAKAEGVDETRVTARGIRVACRHAVRSVR